MVKIVESSLNFRPSMGPTSELHANFRKILEEFHYKYATISFKVHGKYESIGTFLQSSDQKKVGQSGTSCLLTVIELLLLLYFQKTLRNISLFRENMEGPAKITKL